MTPMAELANPALSREKAEAIARAAAKQLWPSMQSEASMAAVSLDVLGRHFDIPAPKLVIDSEVARQFADLTELFTPPRWMRRNQIEQAIREKFDIRD